MELDAQNRKRQIVEQKTFAEADLQVVETEQSERAAIIVGSDGWHLGVIGIVASRLCRKYGRPAIVVGFDVNGRGKGSGRSVHGFSLVEALSACHTMLERYGGHAMAAGLTVSRDSFELFRKAFLALAENALTDDALSPLLQVDAEMDFADVKMPGFRTAHENLGPFGSGNLQPVFIARGVAPDSEPRWLKEKHLSLRLRQRADRQMAIYFSAPQEELPRPPWDIAFQLEPDDYRDRGGMAVHIQGIRSAQR
jgi:single-stranded-DNA-specific exonuclease